jgi:hypothetical protein
VQKRLPALVASNQQCTALAKRRLLKTLSLAPDAHAVRLLLSCSRFTEGTRFSSSHVNTHIVKLDQRAQGHCTCDRADQENTVKGATCACGKRPSGMYKSHQHYMMQELIGPSDSCTCGGTEQASELETDFTTKK